MPVNWMAAYERDAGRVSGNESNGFGAAAENSDSYNQTYVPQYNNEANHGIPSIYDNQGFHQSSTQFWHGFNQTIKTVKGLAGITVMQQLSHDAVRSIFHANLPEGDFEIFRAADVSDFSVNQNVFGLEFGSLHGRDALRVADTVFQSPFAQSNGAGWGALAFDVVVWLVYAAVWWFAADKLHFADASKIVGLFGAFWGVIAEAFVAPNWKGFREFKLPAWTKVKI